MTNATLKAQRPSKKEVNEPPITKITTPENEEEAAVAKVEQFLAEQNPNGPVTKVRAITAETPIPQSPELEAIGAERVGSEKPQFGSAARDTQNLIDIVGKPFTGKSVWGRLGAKGKEWISILRRKMTQEASVQKGDPNALNVGE